MNVNEAKQVIRDNFLRTNGIHINDSKVRNIDVDEYNALIQFCFNATSYWNNKNDYIGFRFWLVYNDFGNSPSEYSCKLCSKELKRNQLGKSLYCSRKCAFNNPDILEKKSEAAKKWVDEKKQSGEWDDFILEKTKKVKVTIDSYGDEDFYKERFKKGRDAKKAKLNLSEAELREYEYKNRLKHVIKKYGSKDQFYAERKRVKQEDNGTYNHLSEESKMFLIDDEVFKREMRDSENSVVYLSHKYGVSESTIYKKCVSLGIEYSKRNKSGLETLLANEIYNETGIMAKYNDRTVIKPKELDLLFEDHNLAIEINGIRWHSEEFKHKTYHYDKMIACSGRIHLMQFNDYEIKNKLPIVKSMIISKMNILNKKVFARNTKVIEMSRTNAASFFEDNHIQGNVPNTITYGLVDESGEVVLAASFGKSRYNKNYEYELLRLCSKQLTSVVGGASKLFKHFIKNYNPKTVVSYCDLMYNTGRVYENLGFSLVNTTSIGYKYVINNKLENRIKYQKHKLSGILDNFDPNLTECENMKNNGHYRYWDCGQKVFLWECNN